MGKLCLTNLPVGVRFKPTEEEIIQYFLSPKINGSNQGTIDFIHEVNFFKEDPCELIGSTGIETTRDPEEWFFFSKLDPKYRNGNRTNRKTKTGYWKGTGGECEIKSEGRLIGKKKILVFHTGQSPSGKKTDWVVHEYHATELDGNNPPRRKAFVLCHLFWKSNNGSEGRKGNSSEAGPSKSKQAWASISTASGDEADNPVAEVTAGQNTSVFHCSFKKYKKSASNKAGSAVSFPTTSKSRLKETKSNLALPSVQAEDSRTVDGCFDTDDFNGTTSDILVAGGDNNANSFAAGNRETDIEVDLEMEEAQYTDSFLLQDPLDGNYLNGLTPHPNTPAISSPPTAISSLEAESELAPASASPALIGDSNMFCVLPSSKVFDVPPELLGFSPLRLQMLSACMPDCVANDSNYVGDDLSCQYGTNVPAASTLLWGPQPPYSDEFLHNDSSNQKNLSTGSID